MPPESPFSPPTPVSAGRMLTFLSQDVFVNTAVGGGGVARGDGSLVVT